MQSTCNAQLVDTGSPAGVIPRISDARTAENSKKCTSMEDEPHQIIQGPFTGAFQGCTWNCRSMWSKRKSCTFSYALKLAETHDFCIFTETQETNTRRQLTLDSMPRDYVFFSSGISARKGGVGIIIKRDFLNNFIVHKWIVASCGRVACLTLDGPYGSLNIIAVYLDPASVQEQLGGIKCIQNQLKIYAHNIIAGDWNFADQLADRIAKNTASTTVKQDPRPAAAWQKLATEFNIREFEQPSYTCENSHGWSRIDRIYTDMHKADLMNSISHCRTIEHPRQLSDHCPVSFGFRKPQLAQRGYVPAWVAADPNFENAVTKVLSDLRKQFNDENPESGLKPVEELGLLKFAIRRAANGIRT